MYIQTNVCHTLLPPSGKRQFHKKNLRNKPRSKSDHVHVRITYLLADFLMIFILLRSLNPPGEEEGVREVRWITDGEATRPPFTPLLLFSDVQWKADLRRAAVAPPVTAEAEVL